MENVIIVCEDLFGLEIYSLLDQINKYNTQKCIPTIYNILGYISDEEAPFQHVVSPIKRIGSISQWKPIAEEKYVLGICDPEKKKIIVSQLKKRGCQFETIHARWVLAPPIPFGEGSIVAAYSIKAGIHIGKYVTLIDSMLASHTIGDFSTVLRFSNILGDVGESSFVGNHVYTQLGKNVGDNCYVADGSIVVKDVKSGSKVMGIPARKFKHS